MAKKHNHKTIIPLLTIIIIIVAVAASVWRCSCSCTPEEEKKEERTVPHINDSISNLRSECEMSHEFDSIMERYLKRWEINGAQLAISRGDSLIYTHGYGWADKERGVQMEPSMIMRIASVSKLVTAIGVMRLCEMGKLRLSEHVFGAQGVLNDTAYSNRIKDKRIFDITIEQLLRHRAGFNNYAGDPMFSTRYIMMQNHLTTPPDNTTLLKIVLKRRLGYTPGTSSCYSNFGYTLLSMIIARRSGMSYEQFIQKTCCSLRDVSTSTLQATITPTDDRTRQNIICTRAPHLFMNITTAEDRWRNVTARTTYPDCWEQEHGVLRQPSCAASSQL